MSMTMRLAALSDADIERLHKRPSLINGIMHLSRENLKRSGWIFMIDGKRVDLESARKTKARRIEPQFSCDLEKAWHGVHYLLTESESVGNGVLDLLLEGGRPVRNSDEGYGPARTFSSTEMRAVHEAMQPFTDEVLESRFDFEDMAKKDVYPSVIWERNDAEDRQWIIDMAKDVRQFVADCAEKGCGCLIYMT